MSNLDTEDIAIILNDIKVIDWKLDCKSGYWKGLHDDGTPERDWRYVPVTDVPLNNLLCEYECLVNELSSKEVEYFTRKESYNRLSSEIIESTDFKALYGKNNEKVRKEHVKGELAVEFKELKALEFSVDWIRNYIIFLREVIRTKRTIMEVKE